MNCTYSHRNYWKCLQVHKTYELKDLETDELNELHVVEQVYKGSKDPIPERFETRDYYPVQSSEQLQIISQRLRELKLKTNLSPAPKRICYVYDRDFLEQSTRFETLLSVYRLSERIHKLKPHEASIEEMCLIDSWPPSNQQIHDKSVLAVGSVLNVVDNVLNGNYQNGICAVNPPDDHVDAHSSHRFCILNNVALATKYARQYHDLQRYFHVENSFMIFFELKF